MKWLCRILPHWWLVSTATVRYGSYERFCSRCGKTEQVLWHTEAFYGDDK